MDWIDGILLLEQWLNDHIGAQHETWIWALEDDKPQLAIIAFKHDKHRTLFLLQWP